MEYSSFTYKSKSILYFDLNALRMMQSSIKFSSSVNHPPSNFYNGVIAINVTFKLPACLAYCKWLFKITVRCNSPQKCLSFHKI